MQPLGVYLVPIADDNGGYSNSEDEWVAFKSKLEAVIGPFPNISLPPLAVQTLGQTFLITLPEIDLKQLCKYPTRRERGVVGSMFQVFDLKTVFPSELNTDILGVSNYLCWMAEV